MARKTLEERALELYEGYRARKDKDAHAQRVINSVLEPNKSYNYNDLRTIDWNSAVDNYYKNNNANSYYLSRSELAGAIQDRINQYNPINDKYFKQATDYLQGGKARRGSGITNFYDYEKAYQEGKTGEELSKIYNEAVGNASKYAQSLWGRDADNALNNYSNKIWDEGGYSEANVDRYRKDLQDTGLFNDATIDALVEQFKLINPRPQVSKSDYNQAKSDFDIALEQYAKDTYKNRDLSETNLSDIIKERAQQRNNLIDLYSSKIAPYETKQWSNAGILKAAENVASRANAQNNQEEAAKLGLIADALKQYGINTRTGADIEKSYENAYNTVQTLTARKEELEKEIKTLANKRQNERMNTGMYASLDSQIQKASEEHAEVTRALASANNDLVSAGNENNNYIALRRSSELDPNGALSYEQLLKRMEESGESYTIADSMLLADKITTESQIDAEVDRLKAIKKNANTQADKDAIDEQIYWIEGQKNVLKVQKKTEEVKKQTDYSAEIEGINEDIISKSSIFESAFAESGRTGTLMDRVQVYSRMGLMGEQWYNDDYILLFAINGIEDAQNLYDTDIANYGYYETKNVPDDVRNTFNYLFYKNGPEEAKEYWEYFKNSPERKQFVTEVMVTDAAEFSGEHPFRAWLSDRLTMLPRVGESVVSLVTGNATDPYSSANALSQTVAAHEQGVYDTYGSGWGLLYSGAGSVADMAQAAAIGAGAGKVASLSGASAKTATAVQKAVTTAVQVVPGMATTITEQKKVGASDAQAIAMGIITAAAEILTESYSIDLILKNPASALKRVPRNFFAEGSEEVFSNWFTRIADSIINGDNSEFERTYRQAVLNGSSNSDALSQALLGMMQEDAVSLIVGGVGGSAMGGVFDVASHGTNAYAGKSLSTSEYNTLVKYAENNNKLSGLTDSKSDVAKGRLYYAVQNDITERLNRSKDVDSLKSDYDTLIKEYGNGTIGEMATRAYQNKLATFDKKSVGSFINSKLNKTSDIIKSAKASQNEDIVKRAKAIENSPTDEAVGDLYIRMNKQSQEAESEQQIVRNSIQEYLYNSDEFKNSRQAEIDKATNAIVKTINGNKLSKSEQAIISNSNTASEIIDQIKTNKGDIAADIQTKVSMRRYSGSNLDSSVGVASIPVSTSKAKVNGVSADIVQVTYGKNGQMNAVTTDGTTVPISSVEFENETDAKLYSAAATYKDSAISSAFIAGYNNTSYKTDVDVSDYKNEFDRYLNYGENLIPFEKAQISDGKVTDDVAKLVYSIGYNKGAKSLKPGVNYAFEKASNQERFIRKIAKEPGTQKIIDEIGKDLGVRIIITDSLPSDQGGLLSSIGSDEAIFIQYNANNGLIAVTFGHEIFHFLEQYNPKGTKELQDIIISHLKEKGKYESLASEASSAYKTQEESVINKEIAANSMFDVLNNKSLIKEIYKRNGESFYEKVENEIGRFFNSLKKAINKLSGKNQTISALKNDLDFLSNVREKFEEVYNEARENKLSKPSQAETVSGNVEYSKSRVPNIRNSDVKDFLDKKKIRNNIEKLFQDTRNIDIQESRASIEKSARSIINNSGSKYNAETLAVQLESILLNDELNADSLIAEVSNLVESVWNESESIYRSTEAQEFLQDYKGKTIYVPENSIFGTAESLNEQFGKTFKFTSEKGNYDYNISKFARDVESVVGSYVDSTESNLSDMLNLIVNPEKEYGLSFLEFEKNKNEIDEAAMFRAIDLITNSIKGKRSEYQNFKTYRNSYKEIEKLLTNNKFIDFEKRMIKNARKEKTAALKTMSRISSELRKRVEHKTKNGKEKYVLDGIQKPAENIIQVYDFITKNQSSINEAEFGRLYNLCDNLYKSLKDMEEDIYGLESYEYSNLAETLKENVSKESGDYKYVDSFDEKGNAVIKPKPRRISDILSNEDVFIVQDLLSGIRKLDNDGKSVFLAGQRVDAIQSAVEITNYLEGKRSNLAKVELANRNAGISSISGILNNSFVTPVYFFETLGPVGQKIFTDLSYAQEQVYFDIKQIEDFVENVASKLDTKAINKVETYKIGKHEVKMTKKHIMYLYALGKRDAAKGKIARIDIKREKGSWLLDKVGLSTKVSAQKGIDITSADIEKLSNKLSAEERAVADEMVQFMSTIGASWGNEASIAMYGYKKFREKNYISLISSDDERPVKFKDLSQNASELLSGMYAIENSGFTKKVTKSSGTYVVGDIFDIFVDHMTQMAIYHNMAPVIHNFNKIYNAMDVRNAGGKKIKTRISSQWGKHLYGSESNNADTYIKKLILNLNNVNTYYNEHAKLAQKVKASYVIGSIWVAAKQPLSYFKASYVLDNDVLAKAALLRIGKKEFEEAMQYNGLALRKGKYGGYTTGKSRSIKESITMYSEGKAERNIRKIYDALSYLTEKADETTWGTIWYATKLQIEKDMPDLEVGSDQYFEAVSKKFSEVINKTQVVDTPLNRAQIRRSDSDIAQTFAMFADEVLVTYNIARNIVLGDTGKYTGKGAKAKAMANFLASYVLIAALEAAINAFRDTISDKDRVEWVFEGYLDNYIKNFAIGLIPDLPGLSQIVSAYQGFSNTPPDMVLYESIGKLLKKTAKTINDIAENRDDPEFNLGAEIWGGIGYGSTEILKILASFTGLPVSRWSNDIESVIDSVFISIGFMPLGVELNSSRVALAVDKEKFGTAKRYIDEILQKNEEEKNKYRKVSNSEIKGNIRSSITRKVKEKYIDYVKSGELDKANKLKEDLKRLDIGYKNSDFSDWIKEYDKEQEMKRKEKEEDERLKNEG